MTKGSKGLDYLLISLVLLMVMVGMTFTAAQFISYRRELTRQDDIREIKEELAKTAPADVLARTNEVLNQTHQLLLELKEAREEFRSTRFTHAEGMMMNTRIKALEDK